jgi:hypothetical protein
MRLITCGRAKSQSRWACASGVVAAALSAVACVSGCGATCDISDEGNPPEVFTGGAVLDDSYASSPAQSGLLHFPGGKQYQLIHHLGFTPNIIQVHFAFDPNDDRSSNCSGNSCEVRCADDQIIWVKNDTCTEFWIQVKTAGRSPFPTARCSNDNVDAGPALPGVTDAAVETEPE